MNPQQPPGPPPPGWWQAADGRWYPPQPMQQPMQQQPGGWGPPPQQAVAPAPRGKNRGCIIAVIVVVVLVLAGAGIAIYFVVQAANKIGDIAQGGIVGSATTSCPAAAEISSAVGSTVREPLGGSLVGATGCIYLAADQTSGLDVNIVTAPDLIADDQLKDFANEGTTAGASPHPIPVGTNGSAWSSASKSAAIAVGGGKVVLVEIQATGQQQSIGDHTDVAIQLLKRTLG
ncbi:hypothetical protein [Pseudonocardia sp. GCM10023141]|uniref:hypothetical protein n=1 Tax=Pseudonocardia sp. GCM10023141 TaxID=3252653 RepID=UPI00360C185E